MQTDRWKEAVRRPPEDGEQHAAEAGPDDRQHDRDDPGTHRCSDSGPNRVVRIVHRQGRQDVPQPEKHRRADDRPQSIFTSQNQRIENPTKRGLLEQHSAVRHIKERAPRDTSSAGFDRPAVAE